MVFKALRRLVALATVAFEAFTYSVKGKEEINSMSEIGIQENKLFKEIELEILGKRIWIH